MSIASPLQHCVSRGSCSKGHPGVGRHESRAEHVTEHVSLSNVKPAEIVTEVVWAYNDEKKLFFVGLRLPKKKKKKDSPSASNFVITQSRLKGVDVCVLLQGLDV